MLAATTASAQYRYTRLVLTLITTVSLCAAQSYFLAPGTIYGFESPLLTSAAPFTYSITATPANPFTYSGAAGIALIGSGLDPPNGGSANGTQYAFMQSAVGAMPATITGTVSGMSSGASYYLDFYWGVSFNTSGPSASSPASYLVTVNGVSVFNVSVSQQISWNRALSSAFTAPSSGAMTIVVSNTLVSSSSYTTLLLDALIVQSGTPPGLIVNNVATGSFETPNVGSSGYAYGGSATVMTAAPSAANPWSYDITTVTGPGVAALGSPWDPLAGGIPDGNQYTYIQCSTSAVPTFTSVLAIGLTPGAVYYIDMWYATRNYGNSPFSVDLTVRADNQLIFNANITYYQPWLHGSSAYFVPATSTVRLFFANNDATSNDHSILIDAVTVRPQGYAPTVVIVSGTANMVSSFEYPVLPTAGYYYGSSYQIASVLPNTIDPWTIGNGVWMVGGGLAATGSPWDPPGAATPNGNQYAYIQTYANINVSSIQANFTSLTPQASYVVQFWYGVRNQVDAQMNFSLTVYVNGVSLFNVFAYAPQAWTLAQTQNFTAPSSGAVTLKLTVTDYNADDHAFLIDAVVVTLAGASSLSAGQLTSFEYPSLSCSGCPSVAYSSNALLQSGLPAAANPFVYSSTAGVALVGSVLDPPGGGAPSGSQYAFLQSNTGTAPATITGNITGLSSGASYYLDFYWGVSFNTSGPSASSPASYLVTVNGVSVFNVSVSQQISWNRALSSAFTAPSSGAMTIVVSNTLVSSSSYTTLLLDALIVQSGTPPGLIVNNVATGSFETPNVGSSGYAYGGSATVMTAAPSAANPWSYDITTVTGPGVAALGSPWDPLAGGIPDGNQYTYIQCSTSAVPTFTSVLAIGLTPGAVYYIDMWYATRNYGNSPFSVDLTVRADNQLIFNANITYYQPWLHGSSAYFVPATSTVRLFFANNDATSNDHSILIDAVTVRPQGYAPTVVIVSGTANMVSSFEYPVLPTAGYYYGSSYQIASVLPNTIDPWTIGNGVWMVGGGLAATGSPWDPPGAATPNGNQYAYIQTYANINVSSIQANFTSLTPQASYVVQFWYGVRNQVDAQMNFSLTVYVNGVSLFNVFAYAPQAWTLAQTQNFTAPSSGAVTLKLTVTDYNADDHAFLIDAVVVTLAGASSLSAGQLTSFEYPSLSCSGCPSVAYSSNALLQSGLPAAANPFVYSSTAGVALVGSVLDPPGGGAPSGSQYAFLQSNTGTAPATITGNITGLSSGASYYLDFYWGVSFNTSGPSASSPASYLVTVNGVSVFNVSVSQQISWNRALSSAFTAPSSGAMTIVVSNTLVSSSSYTTLLLDALIVQSGTPPGLIVNNVATGSFETPNVGSSGYAYGGSATVMTAAPSAANPWSYDITTVTGPGVAALGSPWDPLAGGIPDGNQYTYIQCSTSAVPTFTSVLAIGLTPGAVYYIDMWYATRNYGNSPFSVDLTVRADNQLIFNANITYYQPWLHGSSAYFVPATSTVRLFFANNDATSNDHSILIDAVTVRPQGYAPTVVIVSGTANMVSSFEYPVLPTAGYYYGSSYQIASVLPNTIDPWTIGNGVWMVGGGLAATGSPWDPPGAATPNGNQYAYIQTYANINVSSIQANFTSLTPQASYVVQFWYGVRNQVDAQMNFSLTVYVNGVSLFNVFAYAPQAWTRAQTSVFTAPANGFMTLKLTVTDYNADDHAFLIDAVNVILATSASSTGMRVSSSTGSFQSTTAFATSLSSSSSPANTAVSPTSSSGLSGGAIAGIVVGVSVAVICCICVLCWLLGGFALIAGAKNKKESSADVTATHSYDPHVEDSQAGNVEMEDVHTQQTEDATVNEGETSEEATV